MLLTLLIWLYFCTIHLHFASLNRSVYSDVGSQQFDDEEDGQNRGEQEPSVVLGANYEQALAAYCAGAE